MPLADDLASAVRRPRAGARGAARRPRRCRRRARRAAARHRRARASARPGCCRRLAAAALDRGWRSPWGAAGRRAARRPTGRGSRSCAPPAASSSGCGGDAARAAPPRVDPESARFPLFDAVARFLVEPPGSAAADRARRPARRRRAVAAAAALPRRRGRASAPMLIARLLPGGRAPECASSRRTSPGSPASRRRRPLAGPRRRRRRGLPRRQRPAGDPTGRAAPGDDAAATRSSSARSPSCRSRRCVLRYRREVRALIRRRVAELSPEAGAALQDGRRQSAASSTCGCSSARAGEPRPPAGRARERPSRRACLAAPDGTGPLRLRARTRARDALRATCPRPAGGAAPGDRARARGAAPARPRPRALRDRAPPGPRGAARRPRRGGRLLVRAGDRAFALLAYEEAVLHYAPGAGAARARRPEQRRCELLLRLGDAQWRAGDVPAARRSFEAADRLSRGGLGDGELLAPRGPGLRNALGGFLLFARFEVGATGVGLLEEAAAPRCPAATARCACRCSRAWPSRCTRRTSRWSAGSPSASEAIAMARRLGDPEALVAALHAPQLGARRRRSWSTSGSPTPRRCSPRRTRDREMQFLAHNARFHCFLELGDRRRDGAEIEAMAQAAELIRQPFFAGT